MAESNNKEKLALKPAEAAELINISLPKMYELCKRADFPTIYIGRTIIIPKKALEEWLQKQAHPGIQLYKRGESI